MNKVTIGKCTLYLGDCLELLPSLSPCDAIVTDWPYGIKADSQASKKSGQLNGAGNRRVAKRDYAPTEWDSAPLDVDAVKLVLSCARWKIIFGGNYYAMPPTTCVLVWDKETNGAFADCELAWTNLPGAVRRLRHLWNGFARKGGEARFDHPTQKPLGVMEWCLSHLPPEVNSICDPFMGSGTTGVAVARRGGEFVGIERNPDYFDLACRRIDDAYRQPDMFVSQPTQAPVEQRALEL